VRTNVEWRYWGQHDPLWAVASFEGREKIGTKPWTPEEFLALGAADFADVSRQWEHYGMRRGRCVEIGCGAGRMTSALARTFDTVLAVDVSEHQVARARELLGPAARNVDFQVVDEPVIPAADASADAVFSCHVFQHLPGKRAVATYLREAYRVLRPGGTVCFHLPVPGAHLGSHQSPLWYWLRNLYKRAKRFFGVVNIAEYHRYDANEVLLLLTGLGYRDVELRIFAMTSNGDYHSYFLARRPHAPRT